MQIEINQLADMCDPEEEITFGVEKKIAGISDEDDEQKIKRQRKEEVKTFHDIGVYEYAWEKEARRDSGAKIIDTTWVDDLVKGKSRLCAREFANEARDDLFAPTPSLTASKWVISEAASWSKGGKAKRLMIMDVKRAFLYGMARRTIYIRLPPEDPRSGEPGLVGLLRRSMYGTRDAGAIWEQCYVDCLVGMGFKQGLGSPCCFYHSG